MKFILFLVAIFVLVWLLRGALGRRGGGGSNKGAAPPAPQAPQPIVACSYCGLHLPRDEALPGRGGVFCGDAHRAAYEKERTPSP